MPNLDKTGPRSEGPTGWGRGGCVSTSRADTSGQGAGLGRGRGAQHQMMLQEEEKLLKARLEEINKEKETRSE